ncbi:hypothetical protein ACFFRR_008554 [Megaselia abdita]
MPPYICNPCRLTFEHCYRFKQMCKKADTALRQFPLTGKWPSKLDRPDIPSELLPPPPQQIYHSSPIILNSLPIEEEDMDFKPNTIIFNEEEEDMKPQIISIVNKPTVKFMAKRELITNPQKKRLLNKESVKILNKEAGKNHYQEPIMTTPVVHTNMDGNIEIVSKILESDEKTAEPDPVKTAIPIQTNVFPCSQCERSFPLKQLLDMHMHRHLRERNFDCEQCDKAFFSKYDLGKHMMTHTGEKPFKCVACGKSFSRSTLLHRHEKSHTDVAKFLCVYCEKPFISKEEMEKHAERHKKHRPFACTFCNKSFAFKQGLERHETIHSRQQPYPCQYCNLSFSTPSKLARHLTAHAGKRPYPCKLCKKSYHLSHHLTRHMRSHKGNQGSYKCVECDKIFTSRDELIYHSAQHATQSLTCPLCKEHFDSVEGVSEHIQQHAEGEQFACEFCDLIFMTDDKLILHCASSHAAEMAEYTDENEDKLNSTTVVNEAGMVVREFVIEEGEEPHPKNHGISPVENTFHSPVHQSIHLYNIRTNTSPIHIATIHFESKLFHILKLVIPFLPLQNNLKNKKFLS